MKEKGEIFFLHVHVTSWGIKNERLGQLLFFFTLHPSLLLALLFGSRLHSLNKRYLVSELLPSLRLPSKKHWTTSLRTTEKRKSVRMYVHLVVSRLVVSFFSPLSYLLTAFLVGFRVCICVVCPLSFLLFGVGVRVCVYVVFCVASLLLSHLVIPLDARCCVVAFALVSFVRSFPSITHSFVPSYRALQPPSFLSDSVHHGYVIPHWSYQKHLHILVAYTRNWSMILLLSSYHFSDNRGCWEELIPSSPSSPAPPRTVLLLLKPSLPRTGADGRLRTPRPHTCLYSFGLYSVL